MKKISFSIVAIVSNTLLLSTAPALALENGESAPADTESNSVAALKVGKTDNFGDCTDTLVTDRWVLTACHYLESVNNEGTQARINRKVYNADSWALSPVSDAELFHLTEKVADAAPARVSRDIPAPGQTGTLYGWNSSSSMTRSEQLPMTKVVVNELLGGGPIEGAPGEAAPGTTQTESIPAGIESIPADATMIPMVQSAILDAHSVSGTGMQGDDSSDPFFVDGKLAGFTTAGTSNSDPDLPSPNAVIIALADAAGWIDDITSGHDTEGVLAAENIPAPLKTVQTSGDHMQACLAIACASVIIATAGSRIKNG